MTTRCHSVTSRRSPLVRLVQASEVATLSVTIVEPLCVVRLSGSRPRLPMICTLFRLAMVMILLSPRQKAAGREKRCLLRCDRIKPRPRSRSKARSAGPESRADVRAFDRGKDPHPSHPGDGTGQAATLTRRRPAGEAGCRRMLLIMPLLGRKAGTPFLRFAIRFFASAIRRLPRKRPQAPQRRTFGVLALVEALRLVHARHNRGRTSGRSPGSTTIVA